MIPQAWIEAYLRFLLRRRVAVAIAIAAVTAGFGVAVSGMRLHTDFSDFYPRSRSFTDAYATCRAEGGGSIPACAARAALRPAPDPYIQTYSEFREMFGSANILSVIVAPKHGDIYTPATLQKIDRITKRVLHSPGVIPYQVLSISHPKLRGVSARAGSITMRELYYPSVPKTQADADYVRFAVHSAKGVRGIYTALDDSAAVVHAGFWEEAINHQALYRHLSALIADETDAEHDIHITGLPWLYVSVLRYADQVALVFGATTAALAFLLYAYFRSWTGVWVPIFSGLLSSVWGLGIAVLLGFNLDPLVLVIPIFLTARALSHSVQSIDRYDEEYFRCGDQHQAIVESYSRLFPPAIAAIVTDGIGLLVIAVTPIPLVQKIAVFASFWVVSLFVSVVTLHPIILSFVKPTPRVEHVVRDRRPSLLGMLLALGAALACGVGARRAGWDGARVAIAALVPIAGWIWWRYAERLYARLTRAVIAASSGRGRWLVVALAAVLLIGGWSLGRTLRVGDLTPGAALLFPDHPYNVGFRLLDRKFLGANQLIVIADAKQPDGLRNAETLWVVDELAAHMGVAPGASATVTVLDVVKQITRLLRDGDPKWGLVPVDPKQLSQFLAVFTNQIAALDRFVDWSGRYASVLTLFRGHSNAEITAALDHAAAFRPADFGGRIDVRFAGGLFGILAAVNRAVEHSYWTSLVLIFAVIFVCVYLTYGSWSAAAILMIPVVLSQVAAEALMVLGSIDLNVNSLPVAAAGAGAGVDYGIYLFSRIIDCYDELGSLDDAVDRAIATTGKAIIFIATTMIAATIFWWFSDLKFQAEMGLLLAVLMAFNAFAGLVVVPSVVKLLRPTFFTARAPQRAAAHPSRLAAAVRR